MSVLRFVAFVPRPFWHAYNWWAAAGGYFRHSGNCPNDRRIRINYIILTTFSGVLPSTQQTRPVGETGSCGTSLNQVRIKKKKTDFPRIYLERKVHVDVAVHE